jgi:hypothetical protein
VIAVHIDVVYQNAIGPSEAEMLLDGLRALGRPTLQGTSPRWVSGDSLVKNLERQRYDSLITIDSANLYYTLAPETEHDFNLEP